MWNSNTTMFKTCNVQLSVGEEVMSSEVIYTTNNTYCPIDLTNGKLYNEQQEDRLYNIVELFHFLLDQTMTLWVEIYYDIHFCLCSDSMHYVCTIILIT